jgi:hypothetical protein
MTVEEEYQKQLEQSEAKRRLHELFNRFPLNVQGLILTKYSGIFNYYNEVDEQTIHNMCDNLQAALDVEDARLYEVYKDLI